MKKVFNAFLSLSLAGMLNLSCGVLSANITSQKTGVPESVTSPSEENNSGKNLPQNPEDEEKKEIKKSLELNPKTEAPRAAE